MELLLTLFLCGDVMLGRGVDQILPHSVDPKLHEPWVQSARTYVELAEQAHGEIDPPVAYDYIWGDALAELERLDPDVRLINLETAVTTNDEHWPGKGIHYRMHPENVPVLTAAKIDAASLANNHVLDWGHDGLTQTIRTLDEAGVEPVGAGADLDEALTPAVLETGQGRVLVFAFGTPSSGIPPAWAAADDKPGVSFLPELSDEAFERVAQAIRAHAQPRDVIVFSIHWGGNWGYDIPEEQVAFAHRLIDEADVDIVHGHSSHHVKGLEVYHDRLILYGCGDFINDYEGIGGHEQYRPDLAVMFFPSLDPATGELETLRLVPMQVRQLQLHRARRKDAQWLRDRLTRESQPFGVRFTLTDDNDLLARWE